MTVETAFEPYVETLTANARSAFRYIRQSDAATRNGILIRLAELLESEKHQADILTANAADLEAAVSSGMSPAMRDRLRLDRSRILAMAKAVREIAAFPDPVGEVIRGQTLASGIQMVQKRVPLGVIFTVYESRPNVTVDVGALCIKSGNAAILRGGKEAFHSNVALYRIFVEAIESEGLPAGVLQLVEETDRSCMLALLQRDDRIDLVVPRGGEGLIRFVSENTRIPVVKHDKGVCNMFVDESADLQQAIEVAANAKLQRPSVCNAIENLLVHSRFPQAEKLLSGLARRGARLIGCERSQAIYPAVEKMADPDLEYATEYLDERLSVKIVDSLEEAVEFIYKYGSGHSEAILTRSLESAQRFERMVDSAAVFVNCSTRFHDGGQMGMGAEVGISTGRLHVRGPMGVRDLTTTVYVMMGEGQIRS
jgi:glutamate-5-semialdehyde dehydrogenase